MKKEYKKPEIVFENLAFKSALASCGFVSTTRIDDEYPCALVAGSNEVTWPGGKGEPAYVPEWDTVLIGSAPNECSEEYSCYHVPDVMMENGNESYIGLS